MGFPFNITNPGILIPGLLTAAEQEFVTELFSLSPNDGDTFIYDSGTGLWTVGPGGGGGGSYTDEEAQDAVGSILVDSSEINFTYNDATPSITAVLVAGSVDESKLDASVNASLDLADSASQPGHTHTASNITDFATAVAATAAVTANTAKVTNATHTGEVTGSGALTVDKTAITNKSLVTAAVGDHVLIADASDSDNLKKVTVQTIIDLASGGSGGTLDQAYDFGGAGAGRSITADSGAVEITVPDTENNIAFVVNQNDTTNNPVGVRIVNTGTAYELELRKTNTGALGPFVSFFHDSASPADGDIIGGFDSYGKTDTGVTVPYGYFNVVAEDVSNGTHDGNMVFFLARNGTIGSVPQMTLRSAGNPVVTFNAPGNSATLILGSDTGGTLYLDSTSTDGVGLVNNSSQGFNISGTDGRTTFTHDAIVPDEAYGVGWNGSLEVPTKNALYDKIETITGGSGISEELAIAYAVAL